MFWLLLTIFFALLIYFSLIKPFLYWKRKGVPQYNFWTVWYDFIKGLCQDKNIADAIQTVYNDFPDTRYYGTYKFFSPVLAIRDPDLIKQITVKDFHYFVDHSNFIPDVGDPLWDNNLFFLKGHQWKNMRITMSPFFSRSRMKYMFGLISNCAEKFVDFFEEKGSQVTEVEMRDIFTRFANDVVVLTSFGANVDSMRDQDNEVYTTGLQATTLGGGFWGGLKFFLCYVKPTWARKLGVRLFAQEISDFFNNIINSIIQARERGEKSPPDVINLLLDARKGMKNGKPLKTYSNGLGIPNAEARKKDITDEDIAAQCFLFFAAGFDSVAALLCFMGYELALNPHVHKKLQKEIDDVLKLTGGTAPYEEVMKMKYMDMVITESFRRWPHAIILHRIAGKPYTIPPVNKGEKPIHLDVGDIIWFPIYGIHNDPNFYPDPNRFDPERFNDENKKNLRPYTFMPFGTGPRVCIASRFAIMEAKVLFFHLLAKFDLVTTDKTQFPLKLDRTVLQLHPEDGFWVGLKPRELTAY